MTSKKGSHTTPVYENVYMFHIQRYTYFKWKRPSVHAPPVSGILKSSPVEEHCSCATSVFTAKVFCVASCHSCFRGCTGCYYLLLSRPNEVILWCDLTAWRHAVKSHLFFICQTVQLRKHTQTHRQDRFYYLEVKGSEDETLAWLQNQ